MDFWCKTFRFYRNVYGRHLTPDLIVLCCSKFSLTLPMYVQQALMLGLVVTKRFIVREWKSSTRSCFKKSFNNMVSCLYLEENHYSLSDNHHEFLDVWFPFERYKERNGIKWLSSPFGFGIYCYCHYISFYLHCFMVHCLKHIVFWTACCPLQLSLVLD